jgi:hypothetical protein
LRGRIFSPAAEFFGCFGRTNLPGVGNNVVTKQESTDTEDIIVVSDVDESDKRESPVLVPTSSSSKQSEKPLSSFGKTSDLRTLLVSYPGMHPGKR